jgi:two-component system response regulator YesN
MLYKVLLVDDEDIVCDALSKFFNWKECEYEVIGTANSVIEAITFLETNDVNLILTDIRMQEQSGIDLLEIINKDYPHINTIVLSGYSEFTYAQNAFRLGALDYLTKPINFEEFKKLLLKLKAAMEKRKKESQLYDDYMREKESAVLLRVFNGEKGFEAELKPILSGMNQFVIARISPYNRLKDYEVFNEVKKRIGEHLRNSFSKTIILNNDVYELCTIIADESEIEAIKMKLYDIISAMEQEDIHLTIGLSDTVRDSNFLTENYKKAGKALRYQKVRQSVGVLAFQQLDMIYNEENGYETEGYAKQILECITDLNQHDKLRDKLAKIIDELEFLPDYSLNNLQIMFMQILIEVTNQLHNYSSQDWDLHKEFKITLQLLLNSRSIEEVNDVLLEHFESIINHIELIDTSKFLGTLINDVIQYLKEHYSEQVSLNVLAAKFYVHPIYLSRLFKEKTGVNFIDYLTKIRINKAKELLLLPEFKIYDICFMVGYESPRYFSKIFKQYTSISPKEFKENYE